MKLRWTDRLDERLREVRATGKTWPEVAAILGFTSGKSCQERARRLGLAKSRPSNHFPAEFVESVRAWCILGWSYRRMAAELKCAEYTVRGVASHRGFCKLRPVAEKPIKATMVKASVGSVRAGFMPAAFKRNPVVLGDTSDEVAAWLAQHKATQCPPAICAPSTATVSPEALAQLRAYSEAHDENVSWKAQRKTEFRKQHGHAAAQSAA